MKPRSFYFIEGSIGGDNDGDDDDDDDDDGNESGVREGGAGAFGGRVKHVVWLVCVNTIQHNKTTKHD